MASASQKGPMAFFSWNTAFGECLQRAHSSRRLPMQVEPICPIDIQSPTAARRRASVGQATFLMFTLLRLSRMEEQTSELQSLMRISYADFCLKIKNEHKHPHSQHTSQRK